MTEFTIRINGGEEQTLNAVTGIYLEAVAAIPAMFEVSYPLTVDIWVEDLLPDYGPYKYYIESAGGAVAVLLVKNNDEYVAIYS